ncbi:MAG: apolipoprotein N-acyltransferase [Blastocatellia bacterium]
MRFRPILSGLPLAPESLLWQSGSAVASALLLLLTFPPFDLGFLAWIALAPLLLVIAGGMGPRRAFWLGWLMGVEFTFFAENWIAHSMTVFGAMLTVVSYAVALLFAAVLGLFPALFAAVMARLVNRRGSRALVLAPVVWAATEWIRPFVTGVTWNALGVSQYRNYPVAKLAQYGGVYLISAVLVAASAAVALLLHYLKTKDRALVTSMAAAGICAIAPLLLVRLEGPQRRELIAQLEGAQDAVTIVGVQPNLPPDKTTTAADLDRNIELTKAALDRSPDKKAGIIIWAESPLILPYEGDVAVRSKLDKLANETGSHLLFNSVAREGERHFNSVQTVSPQSGSQGRKRYDKIRLVPFGEYVPFNAVLKHVVPRVISSESGGFAAGTEAVVNVLKIEGDRGWVVSSDREGQSIERTTDFVRAGSFICYEAAYPDLVRRFVQNGATLLVNVSNDAWFGTTAGARQHLAHAVMRAIENDRDLVRVTNSGISALVTAEGAVVDPMPPFTAASQRWEARPRRGITIYTRHGDWFAAGCAIATLLALIIGYAKKSQ